MSDTTMALEVEERIKHTQLGSYSGLVDVLSWARPYDTKTERRWLRRNLDVIPDMWADDVGNRWCFVPGVGDDIMWSCHTDTAHHHKDAGRKKVRVQGSIAKAGSSCLGADDGTGVWLMMEMIKAKKPGLYAFHRGEEQGCVGSSWAALKMPEVVHGIKAAIAFDRMNYADVITHQATGRTASDAFGKSLAGVLNKGNGVFRYKPSDRGLYTDTLEYKRLIPECTNISVGYWGQHGAQETQDLYFAMLLRDALIEGDFTGLEIARDPKALEKRPVWTGGSWRYDDWEQGLHGFKDTTTTTSKPRMIATYDDGPNAIAGVDYAGRAIDHNGHLILPVVYPSATGVMTNPMAGFMDDLTQEEADVVDFLKAHPYSAARFLVKAMGLTADDLVDAYER